MALKDTQNIMARGVRKISEQTVQEGRALIITEENESQYLWDDIPNGSLKVNGSTGLIMVKLKGQSNWVPSNVRLDVTRDVDGNILDINGNKVTDPAYIELVERAISQGGHTLSIAKDAIIVRENFTIKDANIDGGMFSYEDETGARYFGDRNSRGFWFELKKGHYAPGRNMLDVIIDDCLYRSAASGGVIEVSERKFILPEELVTGMEITVKYYQLNRIGNPYPRIYLRKGDYNISADGYEELTGLDDVYKPDNAEIGDIWIDFSGNPDDEDGYLGEVLESIEKKIPWDRIEGAPTTIAEAIDRGMLVDVAQKNHTHKVTEITGLDTWIADATASVSSAATAVSAGIAQVANEANNAQLLQGRTIGEKPTNIVVVQRNGYIDDKLISGNVKTIQRMSDYDDLVEQIHSIAQSYFKRGMIMAWYGEKNKVPAGWAICDGSNDTPDLTNRFIMGAGRYNCRDIIEAGLPNITGRFGGNSRPLPEPEGAFYGINYASQGANSANDGQLIGFNASHSNRTYGKSDTVQPPAVAMYFIMKL